MTLIAQLVAAGITPTLARVFAQPLELAFERFGIDTPARRAAFVAQASHESAGFAKLEEDLYYRRPERVREIWHTRIASLQDAAKLCRNPQALANTVYAGRNGNGDAASGDGWRYRGRGLFQLTGRANYLAAGAALGRPYLEMPEIVALPPDAALSAGWFWSSGDCNMLADSAQIDVITRRINGPAMAARMERRSAFDEAMRAFA
jgi:putative chitinase